MQFETESTTMFLDRLLEKKPQSNASSATLQLIRKLRVPVSASTVINTIESHPDYPSLYSISDSLSKWKVENLSLKVETERLEELPTPFIAHSKAGGGNFILVNRVNGVIDYFDEKGKQRKKTKEEFSREWDNVVLLAEKQMHSGEKNYSVFKRKEAIDVLRIPFIIGSCVLLVILYAAVVSDFYGTSLLFLKFFGCIVTGLLLWFEVDKSNPVVQQICSAGRHANCTAVLSSKEARLFNFISWSEIGFFYFAGGFLFSLSTASYQLSSFSVLSWLNLFALPYTIFSVFYQWRIAKQWCPLCLAVQALLILEFVVSYFGFWQYSVTLSLPKGELIPLILSFLLPVFFWLATKRVYLAAQEGMRYKKELSKLKYNKEIFSGLLAKKKAITVSPEGLGITLGNPCAKNTIIKVCNPYCGPCAKAHPVIDEILESSDDVKVQIIFTPQANEKTESIVRHLLALDDKRDAKLMSKALDDWYGADKKEYEIFAEKYKLNGELKLQDEKLKAMKDWVNEIKIDFTPTFFVNGYQLPGLYKVEDLKHLL